MNFLRGMGEGVEAEGEKGRLVSWPQGDIFCRKNRVFMVCNN